MKIVTVVGARPQLIKAAPLSRALASAGHCELMVHTGQHYDHAMSQVFFDELGLRPAHVNLGIGSGPHGRQTGAMLGAIEDVLERERPAWVVVFGDTNSTLAAALAAAKLHLPVAHAEAGLRSFDRAMPEEINRVLTDRISDRLWCPSGTAVDNLTAEGITDGVTVVGDIMLDALHLARDAAMRDGALARHGVSDGGYLLATVHRAENTDDPARLAAILAGLSRLSETVLLPLHPRTREAMRRHGLSVAGQVRVIEPLGYLDMVALSASARLIVTDSGGLQKEAYWLARPCVTLRDQTEWVETVDSGWNRLVGADGDALVAAVGELAPPAARPTLYGEPGASDRCVATLSP
jgi:UDP-GlcNAc3NAcA epimerase